MSLPLSLFLFYRQFVIVLPSDSICPYVYLYASYSTVGSFNFFSLNRKWLILECKNRERMLKFKVIFGSVKKLKKSLFAPGADKNLSTYIIKYPQDTA